MLPGEIRPDRIWTIRSVPPDKGRANGSADSSATACSMVDGE
jgi:hypothetical protein